MESDYQLSFSDFPEDAQLRVLSFVNRKDLKAFACTSKKFSALCTNDERLWVLKCTRRWGSRTQIPKWGGGKMSYKSLFNLLKDYETLIRFWIYIYDATPSTSPPLLLFEWCSFYITGYTISPSKDSGYGVIKTPFIWITATSDGEGLVYLDTSEGSLSLTEEDLLKEDSEKLRCTELIIAQVHTEKYDPIMKVWENQDFLDFRRRLSFANGLEEEYENVYSSPPDGLMTQIREALEKTVSIPVPDEYSSKKLNSRQRRRRQRENQIMKAFEWEASYFLQLHERYDNYSRPPDQPLQGLWKGIARGKSLTLYVVTYTIYMGVLSCKMAGQSAVTSQVNDGLVFSASMEPFLEPPFASKEKHIYDSRLHLRPAESNQPDPTSSHVVRIFYANLGPESSAPEDPQHAGGRIWLYADGSFGFGSLKDHYIIDLKPMVEDDKLLDVVM